MDDKGKKEFCERVKIIAEKVGGQAELSRRAKISAVTINSYISGKSDVSRERLVALSKAAGVSLFWLATGYGQMEMTEFDAMNSKNDEKTDSQIIFDYVMTVRLMHLKQWWMEEYGTDNDYSSIYFAQIVQGALPEFSAWLERHSSHQESHEDIWDCKNYKSFYLRELPDLNALDESKKQWLMNRLEQIHSFSKKDRKNPRVQLEQFVADFRNFFLDAPPNP